MGVTTGMREYLSIVAETLINGGDDSELEKLDLAKDRLWDAMTEVERDFLNGLVEDIFGEWL